MAFSARPQDLLDQAIAPQDVANIAPPGVHQDPLCDVTAVARAAMHGQGPVGGYFVQAMAKFIDGNVDDTFQVAGGKFLGRADVQHQRRVRTG